MLTAVICIIIHMKKSPVIYYISTGYFVVVLNLEKRAHLGGYGPVVMNDNLLPSNKFQI